MEGGAGKNSASTSPLSFSFDVLLCFCVWIVLRFSTSTLETLHIFQAIFDISAEDVCAFVQQVERLIRFFRVLLSFQRCAAACICLHFHVDLRCVSKRYENVPNVHFCFFSNIEHVCDSFSPHAWKEGRRIHFARYFICFLQSVFFSSLVPGTHRCLNNIPLDQLFS